MNYLNYYQVICGTAAGWFTTWISRQNWKINHEKVSQFEWIVSRRRLTWRRNGRIFNLSNETQVFPFIHFMGYFCIFYFHSQIQIVIFMMIRYFLFQRFVPITFHSISLPLHFILSTNSFIISWMPDGWWRKKKLFCNSFDVLELNEIFPFMLHVTPNIFSIVNIDSSKDFSFSYFCMHIIVFALTVINTVG